MIHKAKIKKALRSYYYKKGSKNEYFIKSLISIILKY
jgi:hypothetical protein